MKNILLILCISIFLLSCKEGKKEIIYKCINGIETKDKDFYNFQNKYIIDEYLFNIEMSYKMNIISTELYNVYLIELQHDINIYKLDNYNDKINFTKYELNKLPEFKEKIKKIEDEKNSILNKMKKKNK